MTYNIDFLIAAMVILLLVLWYFLGQKRAEDLNNQVFLFFAIIGILDVVAELASNYYISFPNSNCEIAAMLATTIFYLLQALLPFTVICYIQTLHDNKIISAKKMFLSGVPTFILMGMILTNPFTEKLFYMGQLSQRVVLIHELGQRRRTEELLDGCHHRTDVDEGGIPKHFT